MPRLGAQVLQGPARGSQDTGQWVLLPVRREDSQLLSTGGPSTCFQIRNLQTEADEQLEYWVIVVIGQVWAMGL